MTLFPGRVKLNLWKDYWELNPVANTQRDVILSISEKPTAFTLVELLVVISIIPVMMAIMLPSLTNAQKQGESIHCLASKDPRP